MKLSEMTPEQKRVKIAGIMGFKWWKSGGGTAIRLLEEPPANRLFREIECPLIIEKVYFLHVPDYLNDLNSIHGAMDTLTYEQSYDFSNHVDTITMRDRRQMENRPAVQFCALCASASQRADAFLLTMGVEP